MDKTLKQSLQIFATKARMGVLEGVYNAQSRTSGWLTFHLRRVELPLQC